MKWWHILLVAGGGYLLYKMMKPSVAIAAAGADTASELDQLRQTLEAKLKSLGKVVSTKVSVEGDQVMFRDATGQIIFQAASSLTPEAIAQQIESI